MGWKAVLCAMLVVASAGAAGAAPYGPALPPPSKTTPVEQTRALYNDEFNHGVPPPCQPAKAGEVVVCGSGRGGSAERLPLPDLRGPPDHARQATVGMPNGTEALARAGEHCNGLGCGNEAGINLLAVPFKTVQIVHGLIDPEWASDKADAAHPVPK